MKLVIADANFPAHSIAQRLVAISDADGAKVAEAVLTVFPLDTYGRVRCSNHGSDGRRQGKGNAGVVNWPEYERLCGKLDKLERLSPHIVKRKSLISKDFFFPWQWEFQQMSRSYRHFRIKCAFECARKPIASSRQGKSGSMET